MELTTDADHAASKIPDGSRIVVPPGFVGAPMKILQAIGNRRWDKGVEILLSTPVVPDSVIENAKIRLSTWHILDTSRSLVSTRRMDLLPWRYSELARFLTKPWDRPKVLLAQVGRGVGTGSLSPGVSGSVTLDMAPDCDLVVAEINGAQPRVQSFGDDSLRVDWGLEVESEPPVTASRRPTAIDRTIGRYVSSLIPDGATLQLGLGGVLNAVAEGLMGHRGLGIHTGMISDGIRPLMERGVVTNEHKGWMTGRTVTGLVIGSSTLVDWVDENPDILLAPISTTHEPRTLVDLQAFVAVNSALEVDIHGQVGSEYLAGEPFAGMGGQPDFAFAAASSASPGAASIVALPSTSSDGMQSRIVPQLSVPTIVTTPRYCVDFVVTEWGIASLRGLSNTDRERALIAVAHPTHREALERAAFIEARAPSN